MVSVRSRDVPPELEPSIVTKSAPFRVIRAPVLEPVMVGLTPEAGLMVTVFVALAPPFGFMLIGKVSDG